MDEEDYYILEDEECVSDYEVEDLSWLNSELPDKNS